MKRPVVPVVLTVVVVVALMATAAGLQSVRDERYPASAGVTEESLYLTSGPLLKRMTVGYNALAADVYWIRAIQYYGGHRIDRTLQQSGFPLLYPLLDLTTTLDSRFNIVYRFGAIFLAEEAPGGAGRPDQAIALLEKGLREVPDRWAYQMDIAFVNYWHRHDYGAAADAFDKASQMPGAPWWLRSMAATTRAQGGDRTSSKRMWQEIGQSADNDWLRRAAQRALLQLRALDEVDVLQELVRQATPAGGRAPSDWRTVVRAGRLRGIPLDPAGIPYNIGPDGTVGVGPTSPLSPLPEQLARTAAVQ